MFDIWRDASGIIHFKGSFGTSESDQAAEILDNLTGNPVLDFGELKHISSTGLGLLIKAQRNLDEAGGGKIRITNCNVHIREIFAITRFDLIFDMD